MGQVMEMVIDMGSGHPGGGAFVVDNFVGQEVVDALIEIFERQNVVGEDLTKDSDEHRTVSERRYFLDCEDFVGKILRTGIRKALKNKFKIDEITTFQHLRFLHYNESGGCVPPHVDLNRTNEHLISSTHTFILYLSEAS